MRVTDWKLRIGAAAVVALLVLSTQARAADAPPKQVTSIEGITEYRLDNGCKVLLFPDASKPNSAANARSHGVRARSIWTCCSSATK